MRSVAAAYGVTSSALHRHASNHLPAALQAAASEHLPAPLSTRRPRAIEIDPRPHTEAQSVQSDGNPASGPETVGESLANTSAEPVDLLATIRGLAERTFRIMEAAENSGDQKTALAAIREARSTYETIARLSGGIEVSAGVTSSDLLHSPQWQEVRSALLEALEPHLEARLAVTAALAGLEAA